MSKLNDDGVLNYCNYDTVFVLVDVDNTILAFCDSSVVGEGCGWVMRVHSESPKQMSGITIANFKQLEKIHEEHSRVAR